MQAVWRFVAHERDSWTDLDGRIDPIGAQSSGLLAYLLRRRGFVRCLVSRNMAANFKTVLLPLLTITVLVLIWTVFRQAGELAVVKSELLRSKREQAIGVERAKDQAKSRAQAQVNKGVRDESTREAGQFGSERHEDALARWLGKVQRLSAYLEKHPELSLSGMGELPVEAWLDVTKAESFETDADFRRALGTLRGLVRQKYADHVTAALRQLLASNGEIVSINPESLAPYLPAGFDPAVLRNLQLNPSGKIVGLVTKDFYPLVDRPVDLWDATLFYGERGWGARSASARGEERVASAIKQFTQATGRVPTEVTQLANYEGVDELDGATAHELFHALVTKP